MAQAGQQESQVAAADSTQIATDQTTTRIGVPMVEPGSDVALLFTVGMADDTLPGDALPLPPPYRRVSTAGKVALVVVGLLVAFVVVVVAACCPEN